MKVNPLSEIETFDIYLDRNKYPKAFKGAVDAMSENFPNLSREDVEKQVENLPITMELYYCDDQGLMAIEAEALSSITPYNPYDGTKFEDPNTKYIVTKASKDSGSDELYSEMLGVFEEQLSAETRVFHELMVELESSDRIEKEVEHTTNPDRWVYTKKGKSFTITITKHIL